jgi:phosphotransferase system IIB component
MTDAEVATTAIVAALFFSGNIEKAKCCLYQLRLITQKTQGGETIDGCW